MGLFDTTWIVEFEYSEGFFSSYKKSSIEIQASSEYDAKDKAKAVLKPAYSYLKILGAYKSNSGNRNGSFSQTGTFKPSSGVFSTVGSGGSDLEQEKERLRIEKAELERERRSLEEEKERIRYERWYQSLSDEEKKAEDVRVAEENKKLETEYKNQMDLVTDDFEVQKGQKKRKIPVSFFVLAAVDAFLVLVPIGIMIAISFGEKVLEEGYKEALEEGLKGLQMEYQASLEQIKGLYVFLIVLLVIFSLFAFVSLYFSYRKVRGRKRRP